MILPDYPLLEYEPQYKQEMRPDAPVWWDMDQIIERTEVYCKWHTEYYEQLGMQVTGWWMSKLALDDIMRYEWLN